MTRITSHAPALLSPLVHKKQMHAVSDIARLFNACFLESEKTRLRYGANEPIYLPASGQTGIAEVVSTSDYFSSALHEISHWCIAGAERRRLVDYGYWYEPDGRDIQTQALFEKVEVKPQALEWVFSEACGVRFRLSVDNVALPELKASQQFIEAVAIQANRYVSDAMPVRASVFLGALLEFYGTKTHFANTTLFDSALLV